MGRVNLGDIFQIKPIVYLINFTLGILNIKYHEIMKHINTGVHNLTSAAS